MSKQKITLEQAETFIEGKLLGMDILEAYNYLSERFEKALETNIEYESKAYYIFIAIKNKLVELEKEIKGIA